MIRTITIEREYGAGGAAIAERLAEQLGWKLWDQTLTAGIAQLAKVDQACVERMTEHGDSALYRLLKVFMRGSYERSLPVAGGENLDSESLLGCMQRVIEQAADEGKCVIVGRGSPYFLRHRKDVFHVFVYAPHDEKLRRLRQLGKSESEAAELLSTVDEERAAFIRKYFGKEWPNRYLYDLMINSKAGEELVVRTIVESIAALDAVALAQ